MRMNIDRTNIDDAAGARGVLRVARLDGRQELLGLRGARHRDEPRDRPAHVLQLARARRSGQGAAREAPCDERIATRRRLAADAAARDASGAARDPLPMMKASFCGAHNGMYIFDAFGDIYACWERPATRTCESAGSTTTASRSSSPTGWSVALAQRHHERDVRAVPVLDVLRRRLRRPGRGHPRHDVRATTATRSDGVSESAFATRTARATRRPSRTSAYSSCARCSGVPSRGRRAAATDVSGARAFSSAPSEHTHNDRKVPIRWLNLTTSNV